MVNLNLYQQVVQDLLTEIYSLDACGNKNGVESQLIFDTQNHHYLLVDLGWEGKHFTYGTIIQ